MLQFDISSENLDHYFANQCAGITEHQKELLPKELNYKIYKKRISRLSFLAKIYVLVKALRKRMIILVEDENGMSEEEFFKYKKSIVKKVPEKNANKLVTDATFVLANKELMDTYASLNLICASGTYRYLAKGQNISNNRTTESIKEQNYICRFLSYYESNRKTIALKTGINMSEWLVLIHLYHGQEVLSSAIYNDWYRYSFNSSKTKIKVAFGTLQLKGYIEKTGFTHNSKFRITALGKMKTWELMSKYVVNC